MSESIANNNAETTTGGIEKITTTTTAEPVLVVVSKVKDYIRQRSGMNTAGTVPDLLSTYVRKVCDAAIERAAADGRKTVMDRDFDI